MIENEEQKIYLENIISQIEAGKMLSEIISGHNSKIKRLLFEECGERGKRALILDFERKYPIFKILELYNNGFKLDEVDEKLGLATGKSTNLIIEYEFLTGKKFQHLYSGIRYDLDSDEIIEEYRSGKTINQIAAGKRCSGLSIQKRINEYMAENGDELKREHDYNFELLKLSDNASRKKYKLEDVYCNSNLKIATRNSIKNVLSKYDYTYEKLSKETLKAGYFVQREVYDRVIEELKKQRKGEDR